MVEVGRKLQKEFWFIPCVCTVSHCKFVDMPVLSVTLQRHRPGAVWEAADGGRSSPAVPGLQEYAAGRGRSLRPPELPHRCSCGPPAAGCGLCTVGARCCPRDQGQVLTSGCSHTVILHAFSRAREIQCRIKIEGNAHYVFLQVQQNWLSVSKCRNYAQSTSECQSFLQGSVFQVMLHFLAHAASIWSHFHFTSALWLIAVCHLHLAHCLCFCPPPQERRPHVCNRRGSPHSTGPHQLRWSAGGFRHQSVWSFSPGMSQPASTDGQRKIRC